MKIFGIGLSRTGTTSLRTCFKELGFKHLSCRYDLLHQYRDGKLNEVLEVIDEYQSFDDWPYPLMYKELFQRYKDSKFILTTRSNPNIWLESLKQHSLHTHPIRHCRYLGYGYNYPFGFEEEHLHFYNNHNNEVIRFFENNNASNRLLTVCWEKGTNWNEICKFLDIKFINDQQFPHENKMRPKRYGKYEIANSILSAYFKVTKNFKKDKS